MVKFKIESFEVNGNTIKAEPINIPYGGDDSKMKSGKGENIFKNNSNDFLKEMLRNFKPIPDDMFTNHTEDGKTIFNVPCRDVEGIGLVYSSSTMGEVLKLLGYMRENDIKEINFKLKEELTK